MERQVKTGSIATACALVAVAALAYTISGGYNTTGGYMSGYASSGEYTTGLGAGAAAYLTNATHSTFLGAASGVAAADADSCVGIGYRALRQSSGCYRCVAIGSEAGAGWENRSDMTCVNGQIIAYPGRLAIHDQPLAEFDESMDPALHDWRYYDINARPPTIDLESVESNGEYRTRLTLRADEVVVTNGVLKFEGITVTSADWADLAGEANYSYNGMYADFAYRLLCLPGNGESYPVEAEEVMSRIRALESACTSFTNRIAALEAMLVSVTNTLHSITNTAGGNQQ